MDLQTLLNLVFTGAGAVCGWILRVVWQEIKLVQANQQDLERELTDNLDDWLLAHQVEHQAFAQLLGLNNPFNMLDVNFNNENDFYDWIGTHLTIHQQIASALNLI